MAGTRNGFMSPDRGIPEGSGTAELNFEGS